MATPAASAPSAAIVRKPLSNRASTVNSPAARDDQSCFMTSDRPPPVKPALAGRSSLTARRRAAIATLVGEGGRPRPSIECPAVADDSHPRHPPAQPMTTPHVRLVEVT